MAKINLSEKQINQYYGKYKHNYVFHLPKRQADVVHEIVYRHMCEFEDMMKNKYGLLIQSTYSLIYYWGIINRNQDIKDCFSCSFELLKILDEEKALFFKLSGMLVG